jgi:integration host factor subunit alpha
MTLTKDDIADSIYNQCGFSRTTSVHLVEAILEMIKHTLESGEDVMLSRFGKFTVGNKKARRGRNPATGKSLMLEPRRVVTFHCSPVLRTRINRKIAGSD